jgi:uncharacterized RDD family membrane protein YckC
MALDFLCSGCQKQLRVPHETTVKMARCPDCGAVTTIPANNDASSPFADTPLKSQEVAGPALDANNPYQSPQSFDPIQTSSTSPVSKYFTRDRLASRGKRFLGRVIDNLITILGMVPAFIYLFVTEAAEAEETDEDLFFVMIIAGAIFINIFQWYLITTSGQSIGKKVLGTRIVCARTKEITGFARAVLAREWLPAIISQIPFVGGIFGLVNALAIFGQEHRCVHDHFANTIVIDA